MFMNIFCISPFYSIVEFHEGIQNIQMNIKSNFSVPFSDGCPHTLYLHIASSYKFGLVWYVKKPWFFNEVYFIILYPFCHIF